MERFANKAQTTLNGSISSGATTLTVTSAAAFPTSGTFRLIIESELLLVTGVAGAVFTVTRGAEGTTAAAHADLSAVTAIVTAGAIAQLKTDVAAAAASAIAQPTLVFRPGVASADTHVATWAEVEAFITAHAGRCTVYIDASIAACVVPNTADTECFGFTTFIAFDRIFGTVLTIADGGRIKNGGVFDFVAVEAAPTGITPLLFNTGLPTFQYYALVQSLGGTTVPMMQFDAALILYMIQGAQFNNELAPGVALAHVADGVLLTPIYGEESFQGGTETISSTTYSGGVTAGLAVNHDASIALTVQSLFLGTVVDQRTAQASQLLPSSGTTAARPATPQLGEMYYDTTLDRPVWWDGAAWIFPSGGKIKIALAGDHVLAPSEYCFNTIEYTAVPAGPTPIITYPAVADDAHAYQCTAKASWPPGDFVPTTATLTTGAGNEVTLNRGTVLRIEVNADGIEVID